MNKSKKRGIVRLTVEVLHELLALPDDIEIYNIYYDHEREILDVVVAGSQSEVVSRVYDVVEGQVIPVLNFTRYTNREGTN